MVPQELDQIKAAIATSNLEEAREIASVLESRLAFLKQDEPVHPDHLKYGIPPELQVVETWAEIDAEFADYEAGRIKVLRRKIYYGC